MELDVAALYEAARLYAVSVAAGRYEVDTDALQRQITSAVLDLSMAYESIRSAQTEVEQAAGQINALLQRQNNRLSRSRPVAAAMERARKQS